MYFNVLLYLGLKQFFPYQKQLKADKFGTAIQATILNCFPLLFEFHVVMHFTWNEHYYLFFLFYQMAPYYSQFSTNSLRDM